MASTLAYKLQNLKYWNVLSEKAPYYIYIIQIRTRKHKQTLLRLINTKNPDVHSEISRET
jgi:hypothetical protein